ncbi:hypothetical protein [Vibrio splendidus]|uniref:hypothetical protein n=1 Tax=Vibrio splendidus TaxID=29497 RepID=UPI000769F820|nr:hypothetical protein [Vibrio splendidus]
MQKNRILIFFSLTVIILISAVLGTYVYQYLNNPLRLNEGAWQGKGSIYIDNAKIDSNALMLIENNKVRLSINNQYNEFNFTYDVTLILRRFEHVSSDFDVEKRVVRGLDAFIENTNIDIPTGGNLIRVHAWHLDEGRIFIDVEQSTGLGVSYILNIKSDS